MQIEFYSNPPPVDGEKFQTTASDSLRSALHAPNVVTLVRCYSMFVSTRSRANESWGGGRRYGAWRNGRLDSTEIERKKRE